MGLPDLAESSSLLNFPSRTTLTMESVVVWPLHVLKMPFFEGPENAQFSGPLGIAPLSFPYYTPLSQTVQYVVLLFLQVQIVVSSAQSQRSFPHYLHSMGVTTVCLQDFCIFAGSAFLQDLLLHFIFVQAF